MAYHTSLDLTTVLLYKFPLPRILACRPKYRTHPTLSLWKPMISRKPLLFICSQKTSHRTVIETHCPILYSTNIYFLEHSWYQEPSCRPKKLQLTLHRSSETWITNTPTSGFTFNNTFWNTGWSPATKLNNQPGRASGGLVTFIHSSAQNQTLLSSRHWIISKVCACNLTIISASVYFSPDTDLKKGLEELLTIIDEICESPTFDIFIIAGDFNAKLGLLRFFNLEDLNALSLFNLRSSLDNSVNQRGKTILDFMDSNSFILLSGRSLSDTPGQCTFGNKNGKSTVDLIWVNTLGLHLVEDMRVNWIVSDSIHFPVSVTLAGQPTFSPPVFNAQEKNDVTLKLCWDPSMKDA